MAVRDRFYGIFWGGLWSDEGDPGGVGDPVGIRKG